MADTRALFVASILGITVGVLRAFQTSAVPWIVTTFQPYYILEPILFPIAVYMFFYGWTEKRLPSLILAILGLIGWLILTGAI